MTVKTVNLELRVIGHHIEATEARDKSWKLWCLLLDLTTPEAVIFVTFQLRESIHDITVQTHFRAGFLALEPVCVRENMKTISRGWGLV